MSETDLRAALTPLISALRYHFYALDSYPERLKGYQRPAATLEDAVKNVVSAVQLEADPLAAIGEQAAAFNNQTRNMLDWVIAGRENDVSLALGRIGAETAQSPHGVLRSRFDGIDRSYRKRPLGDDPDQWFDYFDAQIRHIETVAELERDTLAVINQPTPVSLGMTSGGLLRLIMLAVVLAAGLAGLLIWMTMKARAPVQQEDAEVPPPLDSATRVVRTVPIDLGQMSREAASTCTNFALEIAEPGAGLFDRLESGQELTRLPPGERVNLRRVQDLPTGERFYEVVSPDRGLSGFIPEKAARIPVMEWACEK